MNYFLETRNTLREIFFNSCGQHINSIYFIWQANFTLYNERRDTSNWTAIDISHDDLTNTIFNLPLWWILILFIDIRILFQSSILKLSLLNNRQLE